MPLQAQTLFVTVRDVQNNAAVENALVAVLPDLALETTDANGIAIFRDLPQETHIRLQISRLDYDSLTVQLPPFSQDTIVTLKLAPNPPELAPVRISENALRQPDGSFVWQEIDWRRSTNFANDPVRLFTALPSVSAATDYVSQFYVRGGTPDQNAFYIDDIPIKNPYRVRIAFGGAFSVLNQRLIDQVQFFPGVLPGQYARQSMAAIAVRTREGSADRRKLTIASNFFEAEAHSEAALPGGFRVNQSYRRSYIGELIGAFSDNATVDPRFSDWQGILSWSNERHSLKLGWLFGRENSHISATETNRFSEKGIVTDEKSHTDFVYLAHDIALTSGVLLKHRLAWRDDRNRLNSRVIPADSISGNMNLLMKEKGVTWRQIIEVEKPAFNFSAGWGVQTEDVVTDNGSAMLQYTPLGFTQWEDSLFRWESWLSSSWRPTPKWSVASGLRMDYFSLHGVRPKLSPQLRVRFSPAQRWSISAGGAVQQQFATQETMLFRVPAVNIYKGTLFSFRLGQSEFNLLPETFEKFEFGLNFSEQYLSVEWVTFYNYCDNYLETFRNGDYITRNSGKFRSAGMESWLNWQPVQSNPVYNIFLSGGWHNSEQFYSNRWHPALGDARISLLARATVPVIKNVFVTTQMQWFDRVAIAKGLGFSYNDFGNLEYYYGVDNQNSYFRWDFRLGFRLAKHFSAFIDVVNVTNQRNLFSTQYSYNIVFDRVEIDRINIYNLPLMAFAGFEWSPF
ncbi:MAG: TonB-dependent receptor [Calditrichaeota bacterium]|nr:TonB-dependent receptor [Calditrichota bacterium]